MGTTPTNAPVSSAPVTSPTSSPVAPPQPLPTQPPQTVPTNPPEGCYSMNHKDCLPDGYPADENTCGVAWLPEGERTGCVGLGGNCGPSDSCCGDGLACFGSGESASCLPPVEGEDDDDATQCTVCDDLPTPSMASKGKECADVPNTLANKCNKNNQWLKKGYCKISCQKAGFGYSDL